MHKKILLVTLYCINLFGQLYACTIWGAIKPDELLIAKNRDFYPGNQKFITVANPNKYKFGGIYGDNQYDQHYKIKMGVNETGLVVFMTFASTIPAKQRTAKIPYYQVMETILENYNSIDEITKYSKQLFSNTTPINYVFADRAKVMICEIGFDSKYKCETHVRDVDGSGTSTFAQTNHYILQGLEQYNLTSVIEQQTSYQRLDKINQLMNNNLSSLTFDKFIEFSLNTEATNDNPLTKQDKKYSNTYQDNSIFRTFNSHPDRKNSEHPNSDQNVSTLIIQLPKDKHKPVQLYLRIIDRITDMNDKKFTQKVYYTTATTTLSHALASHDSIKYQQQTCTRNISSKTCH